MKRCLPMPHRFVKQHHDHKDRTGNLERGSSGSDAACGYQRADCGADMSADHFYRFEELSGNFQDEIGDGDLVETGTGVALTRGATGADQKCIAFSALGGSGQWGSGFGGTDMAYPALNGLCDMGLGKSFAIGLYVKPSSSHPSVISTDDAWVPLAGQDSGELAGVGNYNGMLWYNFHTQQVAVCFNHYQFHTASKDGNPRDQMLNGHFKPATATLTEDAWNKVVWVHDDAAGGGVGQEKLYVNSKTVDSTYASEDAGAWGTTFYPFQVGHSQFADHFYAHFFGGDEYKFLGGGSGVDNLAVWAEVPTADDISQFMTGTGNLSENGTWVILSGHPVARRRIKVNGS